MTKCNFLCQEAETSLCYFDERKYCKIISLSSSYWGGETVVTQFLPVNTLITGLLEGHVFFFIKIEWERLEWATGCAKLSPIGSALLSNSVLASVLAPPWYLFPTEMHSWGGSLAKMYSSCLELCHASCHRFLQVPVQILTSSL